MSAEAENLQLCLYIAGDAPSSRAARQSLDELIGSENEPYLSLEIVDVLRQPARALAAHLLATPTLIAAKGEETFRFVGDLAARSDLKRLIDAYRENRGQ